MNDTPSSASSDPSITDNRQLAQWRDEAAAAAAEPDLYERVRELTARALHERKMDFDELREIVGAITSGVGSGRTARGGEMKAGLREAVAGLDEAVGSAAQKATYTLREAVDQGRSFRDNELKDSLDQLRDLESRFVETLKQAASESGGKLKEEMDVLSEHLKHSGTRTGEQVREALQQLASGVRSTAEIGRERISEVSGTTGERLAEAASGVLAAMSDALKRQSERMRH